MHGYPFFDKPAKGYVRFGIARRLKRNGVLNSSWARGRVVAAADGIEICSSYVRCCDACLERTVKHLVDGEMREDINTIYLQKPFVKAIEKMGLDWVFNLKANQPELLAEAERTTEGKPDSIITGSRKELSLWHVEDAYWPVADCSVVGSPKTPIRNVDAILCLLRDPRCEIDVCWS
jgi:hypothetical protein